MDDDLMLNFSTSGNKRPTITAAKGSWRDKRKSVKRQRKEAAPKPEATEAQPKTPKEKTFRPAATGANTSILKPRQDRPEQQPAAPQKGRIGEKNTVLSSLFTANEEIQVAEKKQTTKSEAENAPLGSETFAGLGIPDSLRTQLETQQISHPTQIQRASVPQILENTRDAFIVAQTGSGKTLAYLLPVLSRILQQPKLTRTSGVFAVVLAPTRELATQIYQSLEALCRACHWIVPGIVIGGEKKKSEKARLRKGVNILVGTPGRLADHFDNTRSLDLSQVRWVILDEGDRLVELGFEETLTKILDTIKQQAKLDGFSELPSSRTHILCSATMNASVDRLKTLTLENPVWIRAMEKEEESAPTQLKQSFIVCPPKLRLVTLAARIIASQKTMVFLSCSDSVDFHFRVFTHNEDQEEEDEEAVSLPSTTLEGFMVFKLHGSLTQKQRAATIQGFIKAKKAILLCTDVASRGLDVQVDTVIEYDPPFAVEDHIHRVGRTARAGGAGSATLFLLTGPEEQYASKIESIHQHLNQQTYQKQLEKAFGKKWDMEATTWHLDVERWLLGDDEALALAQKAFQSHIRAYTTHVAAEKDMFNVKHLHLGHLAKAFGLRDVPSAIKSSGSQRIKKKKRTGINALMDTARRHMSMGMGEYNIA